MGLSVRSAGHQYLAHALVGVLVLSALALAAGHRPPAIGAPSGAGTAESKLPLSFVPNRGQARDGVLYHAQAPGFSFSFMRDRALITVSKGTRGHTLALRFIGASPDARVEATDRRPGRVSYFEGNEHHAGIPTYGRIAYRELWPGIDLVFLGTPGRLKYELHVAPGADPADIRLAYAGAEGVSTTKAGALAVQTQAGVLTDARPRSYQLRGSHRVPVRSRFSLIGTTTYGFDVARYDPAGTLIIDPGLNYSTYLGGNRLDQGNAIAADRDGNAYVAGWTNSHDFPTTTGAFDQSIDPDAADAYVTKLSADGSTLLYSTFLGTASGFEEVTGIAVDANGNAYVTGDTTSADFPTTPGAYDRTFAGPQFRPDVFVTKLNATGSALVWSTFLGGTGRQDAGGIGVDADGNAYVSGSTEDGDFPTTAGAYDTSFNGGGFRGDVFVTKLNSSGSELDFSTFLGGSDHDGTTHDGIDVQGSHAYVAGDTGSLDFPTTAGAFDRTYGGGFRDVFVSKLSEDGSTLAYSTYLGSFERDDAGGLAVDPTGNAFVTGGTSSSQFPTTPGAYDRSIGGFLSDAFVSKLNGTGSGLTYSTFLGGCCNFERGFALTVDGVGRASLTGYTGSGDFPTTADAHDRTYNGGPGQEDAFVSTFDAAGAALVYSTFLGGTGDETGLGIAGLLTRLFVTGLTESTDFPTTPGAHDPTPGTTRNAFVSRFDVGPGPPAMLILSPESATNELGNSHCVTATVADAAGEPTPAIAVRFSVSGAVAASGSEQTDAQGQASFCYQGPELAGADLITAYADSDSDSVHDSDEPNDGATKTWVLPASTPKCSITGGGRMTAENGDRAIFSGPARVSSAGRPAGRPRYTDQGPAQPFYLKSRAIEAVTCEGRRATVFGHADLRHSTSVEYRIEVVDNGQPGRHDTYRLLLSNGYDSGTQSLDGGNIRVRH